MTGNLSLMNPKFIILLIIIVGILSVATIDADETTGAPIGSTGAPNEYTCAKSGCHDDKNNVNTGLAVIELQTNFSDLTNIKNGDTILFTLTIKQDLIHKFGFSLTLLDDNGNSCGDIVISEPLRTQVLYGYGKFLNRYYVTYTSKGTLPYLINTGKWTFKWIVPNPKPKFVDIYLAAVAANNDGTDKGDFVYTRHIRYYLVAENSKKLDFNFSINGNNLFIERIDTLTNDRKNIEIHFFDNLGNLKLSHLFSETTSNKFRIGIEPLPNGNYLLLIKQNNTYGYKKIILLR